MILPLSSVISAVRRSHSTSSNGAHFPSLNTRLKCKPARCAPVSRRVRARARPLRPLLNFDAEIPGFNLIIASENGLKLRIHAKNGEQTRKQPVDNRRKGDDGGQQSIAGAILRTY